MKRPFLLLAVTVASLCGTEFSVAQSIDATAGLVVSVSGDGWIHRDEGRVPLGVGAMLEPGDTLVVLLGGRCRGFAPNGEEFVLVGPAETVLEPVTPDDPLSRFAAWLRAQIARWSGETRRVPLTTRDAPRWEVETEIPAPLLPTPDGAARPDRVEFRWSRIPGIDVYRLTLLSAEEEEIVRTVTGTSTIFEDLLPGTEYAWRVEPAIPDWEPLSSWNSFRVLSVEDVQRIDEGTREADPLEAGVLLLIAGLDQEALAHLDEAVAQEQEICSPRYWRARALARIGLWDQAVADLLECGAVDGIRVD